MRARRVIALGLVALTLTPALVAAGQMVVPAVEEHVVEGHTVFAVIEKLSRREVETEAAAVAVLVRERSIRESRVKGVLWFNDQYITTPGGGRSQSVFYPCGGAVMAVNAGDPDPRLILAPLSNDQTVDAYRNATDNVTGALVAADARAAWEMGWRNVSQGPQGVFEYNHSYLVTDPNDHSWVIDKYDATAPGESTTFPVWVVNLFGRARFHAYSGSEYCGPFIDDPWQQGGVNSYWHDYSGRLCDTTVTNDNADGSDDTPNACPHAGGGLDADPGDGSVGVRGDGLDAKPPAIGYYEPTDEDTDGDGSPGPGRCYEGNPNRTNVTDSDGDGAKDEPPAPGDGCAHGDTWKQDGYKRGSLRVGQFHNRNHPHALRMYNALLYFMIGPDDIRIAGSAPHATTDTNGCQAGTEWSCPGGDDDAEGNSHPFNPPGWYVPPFRDPTGTERGGEWVDPMAPDRACSLGYDDDKRDANGDRVCVDDEHATHNRGLVDLHWSPSARPLEPPVRIFEVMDLEGRTDQWHENNDNPDDTQPDHPGQPDRDVSDARREGGTTYR